MAKSRQLKRLERQNLSHLLEPLSESSKQQLELWELTGRAKAKIDCQWRQKKGLFPVRRVSGQVDHIHKNKLLLRKTSKESQAMKVDDYDESVLDHNRN